MIEHFIRVIVDWNMCMRVPDEDKKLARETEPYTCADCRYMGFQSGKLAFAGDQVPQCEDHVDEDGKRYAVTMIPSRRFGGSSKAALTR